MLRAHLICLFLVVNAFHSCIFVVINIFWSHTFTNLDMHPQVKLFNQLNSFCLAPCFKKIKFQTFWYILLFSNKRKTIQFSFNNHKKCNFLGQTVGIIDLFYFFEILTIYVLIILHIYIYFRSIENWICYYFDLPYFYVKLVAG